MPRVAAKDREAFVEGRQGEILDAALRLFASRGFEAVTMEAIAREVGLTKGTLYLYFDGKKALFDAMLERHSLRPAVADLRRQFRDRPLEDAVHFLVGAVWARLHAEADLMAVVVREVPGHPEEARRLLEQAVLPTNRLLAAFLDEKLGPERAAEINTLVAARSLLGMVLVFFLSQELLGGRELLPIPDGDITGTIAEVFLNGVLGS